MELTFRTKVTQVNIFLYAKKKKKKKKISSLQGIMIYRRLHEHCSFALW